MFGFRRRPTGKDSAIGSFRIFDGRPLFGQGGANMSARFPLPPGMSFEKQSLVDGGHAYVFTDEKLGRLGRVVLKGRPDGRCQVNCELAGGLDAPMAKQRMAVFEPVAMKLVRRLETEIEVLRQDGRLPSQNGW